MSLSGVYKKCINGVVAISAGDGRSMSTSSGFFIDSNHIVTCCHCVFNPSGRKDSKIKVYVDTNGGSIVDADVLGADGTADIAVLRVRNPIPGVTPLKWASKMPEIGDQAIAIGTPYGDVQSVSNAYIRDTSFYGSSLLPTVMESILIDGSAIGGNSGGPLLDMSGEVIGIIAYGYTAVSGGTMNGAVPSWIASPIASWIIQNKRNYIFGTLNVNVSPMYIDDVLFLGMNKIQGYMVIDVLSSYSGLRDGDIITHVSLDGKKYEVGQLNSQYCIFSLIHMNPSENVILHIKREGRDMTLSVKIQSGTSTIAQNGIL